MPVSLSRATSAPGVHEAAPLNRQVVEVPGAQSAFRLELSGADGSTHLLAYGYDAKDRKNCWLGVTPADQTAERITGTLAVGKG